MAIEYSDILSWVDGKQPEAYGNETYLRIVSGRAYYAAYHACRELLDIAPVSPKDVEGGIHKRYVAALKQSNKSNIRTIGKKLDFIRLRRAVAEYELKKTFTRNHMVETIICSRQIIALLSSNVHPAIKSSI